MKMKKCINTKTNEKGFSLLELLLVVAVGAVLILAGLAAYRLVTENNNVNEATRLVNILKQQTQRAFQNQATYGTADIVPILINLRAFPAGSLNAAGTPVHPFGNGDIDVLGVSDTFTITFSDLDTSACIQVFNETTDSDFNGLEIGGATLAAVDPEDIVEINTACAGAATVNVEWSFF
jgi:prepilin-type N-terminal cleavage/methylation domain-containing protein